MNVVSAGSATVRSGVVGASEAASQPLLIGTLCHWMGGPSPERPKAVMSPGPVTPFTAMPQVFGAHRIGT